MKTYNFIQIYNKNLTKEKIEEAIEEFYYKKQDESDRKYKVHVYCPTIEAAENFWKQFHEAMQKAFKKSLK